MRDALAMVIIAACVCMAVFHPWIGVISWTVVSIMNFHRLTWGASDLPVAAALAIATLVGMLFTRDRIRFFFTPEMAVFAAFALWMSIALQYALYFDRSVIVWKQVMKIDFMIFVAIFVLYSRTHIFALV